MMRRMVRSDIVALFVVLFFLSPFIYWSFDRSAPVIVHDFSLVPEKVHAGEKLLRRIEVTRRRACLTNIDVVIIDGSRVRWVIDETEVTRPGPVGEKDAYLAPMIIPPLAAPGSAELRVTATRICNPIHNIWPMVETYPTLKFTILPRKGG